MSATARDSHRPPLNPDVSPPRAAPGVDSTATREDGWPAAAARAPGGATPERTWGAQSPAPLSAPPAARLSAAWQWQRSGEAAAADGPEEAGHRAGGASTGGHTAVQHVQSRITSARSSIKRLSFAQDAEQSCLPEALHAAASLRGAANGRASAGAWERLAGAMAALAAQDSPDSSKTTTRQARRPYVRSWQHFAATTANHGT